MLSDSSCKFETVYRIIAIGILILLFAIGFRSGLRHRQAEEEVFRRIDVIEKTLTLKGNYP